jgi:ATP-dependent exoDNAse (exonuclease V) beta subunit
MKKEIIEIDKEKSVYRITTTDERWYTIEKKSEETGLPFFKFIPSVTWITGYVYKGIDFYKWLANKGWDEAEAIKTEAGDKGSRVHHAIENLIMGNPVKMDDKYFNNSSETDEELKADEYAAIVSFAQWFNTVKPEILLNETTVISEKYNFAGTVDFVCKIGDQVYIVDFKTSQYIWPSMEAQLSAYKVALGEMGRKVENVKLAILQIGYKKNKKLYKFTEVDDKFESLFVPAQKFWENATRGQEPKQIELPLEVKLELTKPEEPKEKKSLKKQPPLNKKKTN